MKRSNWVSQFWQTNYTRAGGHHRPNRMHLKSIWFSSDDGTRTFIEDTLVYMCRGESGGLRVTLIGLTTDNPQRERNDRFYRCRSPPHWEDHGIITIALNGSVIFADVTVYIRKLVYFLRLSVRCIFSRCRYSYYIFVTWCDMLVTFCLLLLKHNNNNNNNNNSLLKEIGLRISPNTGEGGKFLIPTHFCASAAFQCHSVTRFFADRWLRGMNIPKIV